MGGWARVTSHVLLGQGEELGFYLRQIGTFRESEAGQCHGLIPTWIAVWGTG